MKNGLRWKISTLQPQCSFSIHVYIFISCFGTVFRRSMRFQCLYFFFSDVSNSLEIKIQYFFIHFRQSFQTFLFRFHSFQNRSNHYKRFVQIIIRGSFKVQTIIMSQLNYFSETRVPKESASSHHMALPSHGSLPGKFSRPSV